MKIVALFIIMNGFVSIVLSQNLSLTGITQCPLKINYERKSKDKALINRIDKNKITFLFFQDFSDSVTFFVNGNLVMEKYVNHDSTLISTEYTGVSVAYNFCCKKNDILIKYKSQNFFLRFTVRKKWPLYTIHAYRNLNCTVAGRKHQIEMK